jgi:hypothetical protein
MEIEDMQDVIEAFADGELVDPAALGDALATEAGRTHLIDVLTLRSLVGGQATTRPASMASVTSLTSAGPGAPHTSRPIGAARPVHTAGRWLTAVAAVAVLSVVTGYVVGTVAATRRRSVDATMAATSTPAPAPTHVIHLRNGVDWNEKAGGN